MQLETCKTCGTSCFEIGGFGLDFCVRCGLGKPGAIQCDSFVRQDRLSGHQTYTRLKRFKKYLFRAMRMQSGVTIPQETWDYLLERRPYRDAKHVQYTLKQARHLKRKCYDSLPFLTAALCPDLRVPTINEVEKGKAIHLFRKIDASIQSGPFVSYLFCLEYILKKLGRADVCEFINCIQCPKRREAYKIKLDTIFGSEQEPVMSLLRGKAVDFAKSLELQVASNARLVPNATSRLEVALLTGDVPGSGDVANTRRLRQVGLDEDLVVQQFGRALPPKVLEPDVVHRCNAGRASS